MSSTNVDGVLGKAVAWIGGVRWAAQVISWASTLLVVRLLHPEDYGIVTMATTYVVLAQAITEFGIGTAVQARPNMSPSEIAQANLLTLYLGLGAILVTLGVSVPLSRFYGEPRLIAVLCALSPLCLFDALTAVPQAMLMRELRYKDAAVVDLLRSASSSLSVLALALAGTGYWALIAGQLAGTFIPMAYLLFRHARPFERITREGVMPLLHFGKDLLVGRLAWMAYQSAHFAIAGRVLGTVAVGQYNFAWTMSTLPGDKLGAVVSSVLPSILVSVRDDSEALWKYLRTSIETLSIIMIPALLGLAVTAPDFIAFAFGTKWSGAAVPMMILAIYAMLQWFLPLLNQLLLVAGDVAFQRRVGVGMMFFLIPAFYIGAKFGGLNGICIAWLVSWPLSGIPIIKLSMKRMGRPIRDLWSAMSVGVIGAVISSAIVSLARIGLHSMGYGPAQVILIGVPLAILGHIATVLYMRPGITARLVAFFRPGAKPTIPAAP